MEKKKKKDGETLTGRMKFLVLLWMSFKAAQKVCLVQKNDVRGGAVCKWDSSVP